MYIIKRIFVIIHKTISIVNWKTIYSRYMLVFFAVIVIVLSISKIGHSEEYKLSPFKLERYKKEKEKEKEKVNNILFYNESDNIIPKGLTFWIKGGLQLVIFARTSLMEEPTKYDPQWLAEFSVEYKINKYISVAGSIGYSRKGTLSGPYKLSIDYVYITPHIKIYPLKYLFFMIGPSFNIRTIDSIEPLPPTITPTTISKPITYGITFGVGGVLPIDPILLSFEIRADLGVAGTLDHLKSKCAQGSFNDIQLILGIGFPI